MTSLRDIQTAFQNCLLHSSTALDCIVATEKFSAETRLGIYVNAYFSRLIEALASNYPCLQKYLGEEKFYELGLAYTQKIPSSFRSIRWFGDRLVEFLQTAQEKPYVIELAKTEWIMTEVFDAADSVLLTTEDMAAISPEAWSDMRFSPHPSLKRLNLSWNIIPFWQALLEEKPLPELSMSSAPVAWVFWRHNLIHQFCSLSISEAWALDAMIAQASFGEICAGLCEWFSEEKVPLQAASLLKSWILKGFVGKAYA